MSIGEIGTLLPNLSFAALTPLFIAEWNISNADAGWIAGISAFGYMAVVPFLMSLTDRIDARRVFLVGACVDHHRPSWVCLLLPTASGPVSSGGR